MSTALNPPPPSDQEPVYSLSFLQRVLPPMIDEAIKEHLRPLDELPGWSGIAFFRPTVRLCIRLVADEFLVSAQDIAGESQFHDVVQARQVAIWLALKVTGHKSPTVAKAFNRDASTVHHSKNKVASRRACDLSFCARTDRLLGLFKAVS